MQNPILKFRKLEYLIFYNKPGIVLKQNRFFVPVSYCTAVSAGNDTFWQQNLTRQKIS